MIAGIKSEDTKENTITILESDFIKLREVGLKLNEVVENHTHRDDYKKHSNKLFRVVNRYDHGADKRFWERHGGEPIKNEWEKGFREGANHAFSYFLDKYSFDKEYTKRLDLELRDNIGINTAKKKVEVVLAVLETDLI